MVPMVPTARARQSITRTAALPAPISMETCPGAPLRKSSPSFLHSSRPLPLRIATSSPGSSPLPPRSLSQPLSSPSLCAAACLHSARSLSPLPPHSSSVYIGKTLVQVKHVFLITTFPLIAGKKILWSSRFCALGIDNRKPFYPSPVSHSPRACEALGEFGRGPKKRAMPVSHSLPPAPRGHPGHVEVTNHCIPLGTPACSCRVLHTQETPPSAALLGAGADPGWAPAAC